MAQSSILYIHVTGLTSEIIKNLVLAGIRAIICDDRPYPESIQSTPSIFLSNNIDDCVDQDASNETGNDKNDIHVSKKVKRTVADAMKSKIEELNPLLGECEICNTPTTQLTSEYISKFSIIVASRLCSIDDAIRISNICTSYGNKFYMADCFGLYGASIFDLGKDHTYRPEIAKQLLDITTLQNHIPFESIVNHVTLEQATNRFHKVPPSSWIRYRCILEYVKQKQTWPSTNSANDFVDTITKWIHDTSPSLTHHELLSSNALHELACIATIEIAPICSVLGGILGNEIIKAISGKGEPANNTILFDGITCKAWTFLVQPPSPPKNV
jgi:ubiquitin-like 1-activating enzyme E1 A